MQIITLYGYFIKFVSFIMHNWKKIISILCEGVTSQPLWFAGSQLGISKFSIFNNFLILIPICKKLRQTV